MAEAPIDLGLLVLPETIAEAERAVVELLLSPSDSSKLKAAEFILNRSQQMGAGDSKRASATKEDIEHLRGIISEVKTVLEGHVGFYERRFGTGGPEAGS